MTPIVLDTDVFSFLFKSDSRSAQFIPLLKDREVLISFMTIAELEQWALLKNWDGKKIEWMRLYLRRFTVVPSSGDLAIQWARAMVSARSKGRRIESADAWVAATALLYDAPLLTHNKADFVGVTGLVFGDL